LYKLQINDELQPFNREKEKELEIISFLEMLSSNL